jgi:serine phosphatase RsbU (regulator of sigma subunit)
LIESIEEHFEYIGQLLTKKKLQIIQYYDTEFQQYLEEHHDYDKDMQDRADWLRTYLTQDSIRLCTIEEIDAVGGHIKKASAQDAKQEKKVTKLLMGKDKIRI